jgi:hypothetical protein
MSVFVIIARMHLENTNEWGLLPFDHVA